MSCKLRFGQVISGWDTFSQVNSYYVRLGQVKTGKYKLGNFMSG
jgi:hypothetical protein